MEITQCRLCLSTSDYNVYVLDNNYNLINDIEECVSIQILPSDRYSKRICPDCLAKLRKWHDFKMMCLNSQAILEAQLDIKENSVNIPSELEIQDDHPKSKDNEPRSGRNNSLKKKNGIWNSNQDGEENINEIVTTMLNREVVSKSSTNSSNNYEVDGTCLFLEPKCDIKDDESYEDVQTSDSQKVYACEFCTNAFEYYTDYLDHQSDHNGEAIFQCDKCEMIFSTKLELALHERRHKTPCHICGTYVQKQSMKSHLNKHTDKFKCSHCSLTFTCGPLLNEHIAVRHTKIKQYFCDTCGKDFATRSSLVLHLKIHSDEKQYKCDKCDYAGRTSISLRIHMSKHESGTYICEYCSKIFKSIRNLRDHLRRVHQSNKKYSCEFCNMKFSLRYLVEQHKRTHTGIHPYKCSKCFKTFARSDGLKEHLRTHDRTELYKCDFCEKIFRTKRGLKRHNCINIISD